MIAVYIAGAIVGIVAGGLLGVALSRAQHACWVKRNRAEIERMRAEVEAEFRQRGE